MPPLCANCATLTMLFLSVLVVVFSLFLLLFSSLQDLLKGVVDDNVSLAYIRGIAFFITVATLLYGRGVLYNSFLIGSLFFLTSFVFNRLGLLGGADVVSVSATGGSLALLDTLGFWSPDGLLPYWFKFILSLFLLGTGLLVLTGTTRRIRFIPIITMSYIVTIMA